ncbi:rhomboid family intramembrane serine protease [Proteiniclasticum sp. QWL-01]|uniref:rhomboid family intramembrane serine protease n=1 Tax=Proteiniclasticum sp. QWL-01 TaxID=3036945 RepID=UPI0021FF01FB|nr:rhomboid family intramembrane serine protease [Proteiniclasticum sp. QWL-01]UUM10721.1 rhomboid family intramembrane serine protease [Clostridiaceae bacterium HFYG-1003]WFF72058.1 rhomboid family intramembrane serine protease [Proteiniclasticum sp. QWL-01]
MNQWKNRSRGIGITVGLIIINLAAFLYSAWLSESTNIHPLVLVYLGGNYKPLVEAGEYYRLVTAMFLHGDIQHLAFNMYSLWALGSNLERMLPKWKYFILYMVSGLGGSLLSHLMHEDTVSIGASGAIFGLLGALIGYVWKNREMFRSGALLNLLVIAGINLAWGFQPGSGIDNYGHLGGLAAGFLLSLFIKPGRR